MYAGKIGLRHEEAYENVFRRQNRDDWRSGGESLAGLSERISDDARDRRRDMALIQTPTRHVGRGLQCLDRGFLRPDLVWTTHGRAQLGERRLLDGDFRLRRAGVRLLLVDDLRRSGARLEQRLIAGEVRPYLVPRGLGVGEIGLGLCNFGRLAAVLEIGELLLSLGQLPRGLIEGGLIVRVVLVEERRVFGDLVAAPHMDRNDQALLRWADFDEVSIGIALPRNSFRRRRAQEKPPACDGGEQGDGEE